MVKFWMRKDQAGGAPRGESAVRQADTARVPDVADGLLGYLDDFGEGRFQGWVANLSEPRRSVHVEVRIGGKVVRRVLASVPRSDVNKAGHPGDHGFDFVLDPVDCERNDKVELLVIDEDADDAAIEVSTTAEQRAAMLSYMRIVSDLPRQLAILQDVILFDVQDLVSFLHHHNSVTGIQRVVGGIILAVFARPEEERRHIHFCMMADERDGVRLFEWDRLLHVVEMAMAGGADQPTLTRTVMKMRRKAPTYRPKQGDCFFIGGAYWIVPDGGPRLNALKSLGVSIGTYIYDLIPITAPEWVTDATRREVAERAIDILLLSDFLLTISDFVKDDVERLIKAELDLIKPVFSAPLPHQLPPRKSVATKIRPTIKALGDFALCVCTLEGRKNHMLLYRVWSLLLRQKGYDAVPDLVLVGKWGWNIQSFQQACSSSDFLDQKIKLFANVGDDELSYLYEHCLFTVFPSFMEGWGLPVGESLSAGKLCVASTAASIPEVGGDFCEYIDPHDYFGSVKLIRGLIDNRETLAAKNKVIQEQFVARTWDTYTRDLFAVIAREARAVRSRGVDALAFRLEAEETYEITSSHLTLDETVPWSRKAGKFVRTNGWGMLEDWGVWSNEARASIGIRLAPTESETVVLLVELRSVRSDETTVIIEVEPGSHAMTVELTDRARWITVPDVRNNGEPVTVSITATFEPLKEPSRDLYVGLSRIAFCEVSDGKVPIRLLTTMNLLATGAKPGNQEFSTNTSSLKEKSVVESNFF